MPAAARAIENEYAAPLPKQRVLYAEDQESARVVTAALLRKLGYVVDAVEDGELALHRAMSHRYDIILLDIEMPVMDGMTAARRIRSECHRGGDIPILALSAYLADTTEQSVWRSLFDGALPKPASKDELQAALTKAIAARRAEIADRVQEHPVQNLTFPSFRDVLPRTMWVRLVERAADDMHSLALTASACGGAGDAAGLAQSANALKALAESFGADDVVAHAERLVAGLAVDAGSTLIASIAAWAKMAVG
jgi:CheY-like chemotaxis protein